MTVLTDTEENRLIDAIHGTAAYVAPTGPIRVRLVTALGSDAAAGTEVTGGSYTPQTVTMTSAASGSASNTALVRFEGMPAVTVVGLELWDSAGTPRRLWHRALGSPVTLSAGQALDFPAGAIVFSMD